MIAPVSACAALSRVKVKMKYPPLFSPAGRIERSAVSGSPRSRNSSAFSMPSWSGSAVASAAFPPRPSPWAQIANKLEVRTSRSWVAWKSSE
jgi:hypothetical protein